MTLGIPYSFIPGTKAKAEEVNANFIALHSDIESLDSNKVNKDLSNLSSTDIDNLKNTIGVTYKNIGELVYSAIPLNDSGLHLLDGSLLTANGVYQDFIDYMEEIYDSETATGIFCSESDWQDSVTQYGECFKFVYDENAGSLRLPKVDGILAVTTDIEDLGELTAAGLPNITGTFGTVSSGASPSTSGAFTNSKTGNSSPGTSGNSTWQSYSFDASRSSSIYGNSSTVQPQTVKCFAYIVVATTNKTELLVDIDEIATDLNGKADIDGTNMASSVKNFDGQWVDIGLQNIISNTSVNGTTDVTSSLSSILPDDNYNYEVLVRGAVTSSSTSGQLCSLYINSDLLTSWIRLAEITPRSNASVPDGSTCIIPVGTGRTISMHRESSYYGTANVQVLAYRRIGTNS